jgi:ribosome recycling factor
VCPSLESLTVHPNVASSLQKQVHEIAEDHRTAVRNIRRYSSERLKKLLRAKHIF